MTVKESINRLRGIAQRVSPVAEFYAERRSAWHEMAVMTAQSVLAALQPPDAEPEAWAASVRSALARISTMLMTDVSDAGGQLLFAQGRPGGLAIRMKRGKVEADPARQQTGMTMEDLLRWIKAGRDGAEYSPLGDGAFFVSPAGNGKSIEFLMDGKKSDLQVAWRILWAIRLAKGGASRIPGHVRGFAGAKHADSIEGLYPQILKAWVAVFRPRARRELRAWVRRRMKAK